MTGIEKAREANERLKAEAEKEKEVVAVREEEVKNALATIQQNSALLKMYQENADVGMENVISGSVPMLKIHYAGLSTKNVLADGGVPNDGWFYYKPTQEQFKEVLCHFLYVGRGYYAEGIVKGSEPKYNQILAGVLINGGATKPFISYVHGKSLRPFWDFLREEMAKYTKAKPVSVPMFAMTVKMSTIKAKTDAGRDVWIIKLDLVKDDNGGPVVVTDEGEFVFLKDNAGSIKETVDRLTNKGIDENAVEDGAARDSAGNKIEDIVVPDETGMPF